MGVSFNFFRSFDSQRFQSIEILKGGLQLLLLSFTTLFPSVYVNPPLQYMPHLSVIASQEIL